MHNQIFTRRYVRAFAAILELTLPLSVHATLPARTVEIGERIAAPATWWVSATCSELNGSPTFGAGSYSPEAVVFQNGRIHEFVNRKGMLVTLDSRMDTGSLTVRDTEIFNISLNYNYTNGCRVHADGIYVRGNAPKATFRLENVSIHDTGSGIMPIIFDGATIGKVVFRNLRIYNSAHPVAIKLGSTTTATIGDFYIIGSDVRSWNILSDPGRIKRVHIISSPNVNYQVFCNVGSEVFLEGSTVAICNSSSTQASATKVGAYADGTKDSVIVACHTAGGGITAVGAPFDNGGGLYVHSWGGGVVQDYQGGTLGKTICMKKTGASSAYIVRGAIRDSYMNTGGASSFLKYPIANETGTGTSAFQTFAGGRIVWDRVLNKFVSIPNANGNGLKGVYYSGTSFNTTVLTRTDSAVDFNWGTYGVTSALITNFSVKWSGQVLPLESGTYTFATRADDGVRLYVNGQLIINDWTVHPVTEKTGSISLTAGSKVDIRLEYFQDSGGASVQLLWATPSSAGTKSVIPKAQLYAAP